MGDSHINRTGGYGSSCLKLWLWYFLREFSLESTKEGIFAVPCRVLSGKEILQKKKCCFKSVVLEF